MEWMILPFRRYADFRGRSRRREFWMGLLFFWIVWLAMALLDTAFGFGGTTSVTGRGPGTAWSSYGWTSDGPLVPLWCLAALLPCLAVGVRRLHDLDKSGWWLLLLLVPMLGLVILLVFWSVEGTRGPNRFGPDPLQAGSGSREFH